MKDVGSWLLVIGAVLTVLSWLIAKLKPRPINTDPPEYLPVVSAWIPALGLWMLAGGLIGLVISLFL